MSCFTYLNCAVLRIFLLLSVHSSATLAHGKDMNGYIIGKLLPVHYMQFSIKNLSNNLWTNNPISNSRHGYKLTIMNLNY